MRKIVFQVIQYKPFQILVESFVAERVATSPSVFHFRIRTSFQVPGFEWVHELLLLCLTSNSAQFCAEIACGKTGLGHNCTDSRFRMKNDFSVCRRGASGKARREKMGASHQVFLDVDDVMRDHFFLRRSEPKKQGNNFSEFTTVLFTTYLKTHRPVYY